MRDARAIVAELKKFGRQLAAKPRWLVLNKRDLLPDEEAEKRAAEIVRRLRYRGPRFLISAATGRGTRELAEALDAVLENQAPSGPPPPQPASQRTYPPLHLETFATEWSDAQ